MKRSLVLLALLSVTTAYAQNKLKVIKASSNSVDIKDDQYLWMESFKGHKKRNPLIRIPV
ncbi:MAG: hypothetical protein EOO95_14020 [Pedobacter sp.]|nr:MAG: hypothetical protein EOO95_14020 [Pedobacter sp.]